MVLVTLQSHEPWPNFEKLTRPAMTLYCQVAVKLKGRGGRTGTSDEMQRFDKFDDIDRGSTHTKS